MSFVVVVCLVLVARSSPSAASDTGTLVNEARSAVHWQLVGELAGFTTNGVVEFEIDLAPVAAHLHTICSHLKNLEPHQHVHKAFYENYHVTVQKMSHRCEREARAFTKILSVYEREEDLHSHPKLATQHDIYEKNHFSLLPPSVPGARGPSRSIHDDAQKYHLDSDEIRDPDRRYNNYRAPRSTTESNRKEEDFVEGELCDNEGCSGGDYEEVYFGDEYDVGRDDRVIIRNKRTITEEREEEEAFEVEEDTSFRFRFRRFLGAVLGAIGGLLFSGGLSSMFHSGVSASQMKAATEHTREAFNLHQEEINRLNETLKVSINRFNEAESEVEIVVGIMETGLDLDENLDRVRDVRRGLSSLFHQQLDPGLIDPAVLRVAYESLVEQMRKQKSSPIFTDFIYLYSVDVSHRYLQDQLKIVVSVSVPGEQDGTRLQVLRYLDFPFTLSYPLEDLEGSESAEANHEWRTHYVMPVVENTLLAYRAPSSRQTSAVYKTITAADLQGCAKINGLYLCTKHNYVRSSPSSKCLSALHSLRIDNPEMAKYCTLQPAASEDMVLQESANTFRLYSDRPEQLSVNCPYSQTSDRFDIHGLTRIQLAPGCVASVNDYVLEAETDTKVRGAPIEIKEFSLDEVVLSHDKRRNLAAMLDDPFKKTTLTPDEAEEHFNQDITGLLNSEHGVLYYTIGGILVVLGTIVLIFTASFFFQCKSCQFASTRRLLSYYNNERNAGRRGASEDGNDEGEEGVPLRSIASSEEFPTVYRETHPPRYGDVVTGNAPRREAARGSMSPHRGGR